MTNKFNIDFLENYSQESLIDELQRIQKIIGDRPITRKDIDKHGKVNSTTFYRKFGSFSKALLSAGLNTTRRVNVSDEELIKAVIELWTVVLEKEGRRPFSSDLKTYKIPYSKDSYRRRFGSWKKALILAYNSVGEKDATQEQISEIKIIEDPAKVTREEVSIRKRFLIFKRDQFACVLCARAGVGVRLEVDHRIPLSKGGGNGLNNLQTLCFECNRGKRNDHEHR